MPQQAASGGTYSQQALIHLDLSCSENGDDLCCSFDSPCWPTTSASTLFQQGSYPIPLEDFMSIIGEDNSETLVALLADEAQYHMTSKFLDGQHGISSEHRHFLVSWMMTAATYHNFGAFTSALAVNLLDRFLAAQRTNEDELWALQLAAVACLSVAAKMEEGMFPTNIGQFQVAAPWDQPFDVSNIKSMELVVLATLQWRVVSVTATNFVDRLLRGIFDAAELHGTELLLELRTKSMALVAKTLPEERYLDFRPSTVAAAAILVTMRIVCDEPAIQAADTYLNTLTDQVNECEQALSDDFKPDMESTPSSPYRDGLFETKGGSNNPTPTSVLQLEETLTGELPPLRDMW